MITIAINIKEREYRAFQDFSVVDEQEMVVEGYAAVFDSPTILYNWEGIDYKEQIARGAFNNAEMQDVILNYDHQGKVVARTRNKTLMLTIDDKGLLIRAQLGGTEEGRRLYEEVRGGYLDKMSFAFTVAEDDYNKQTHMRTINKFKRLYDVSIVSIPAYNDTTVSARSFFSAAAEEERKALDNAQLRQRLLLRTLI